MPKILLLLQCKERDAFVSVVATAVSVTAAKLMMQKEGIVGGWLRWPGAQQGLRQDGRPGPTAASPHANAGHANNSGVAANPISIVYNK